MDHWMMEGSLRFRRSLTPRQLRGQEGVPTLTPSHLLRLRQRTASFRCPSYPDVCGVTVITLRGPTRYWDSLRTGTEMRTDPPRSRKWENPESRLGLWKSGVLYPRCPGRPRSRIVCPVPSGSLPPGSRIGGTRVP